MPCSVRSSPAAPLWAFFQLSCLLRSSWNEFLEHCFYSPWVRAGFASVTRLSRNHSPQSSPPSSSYLYRLFTTPIQIGFFFWKKGELGDGDVKVRKQIKNGHQSGTREPRESVKQHIRIHIQNTRTSERQKRLGSKWALPWDTWRGEKGSCDAWKFCFFTIFIFFLFWKKRAGRKGINSEGQMKKRRGKDPLRRTDGEWR
jgi:hypothetical protein